MADYNAGLGNYGLNHLPLTPESGPRSRLTAVLTYAVLEHGRASSPLVHEECQSCKRCLSVCPVPSLHAESEMHEHKCGDLMFSQLGGLRCGLCLKACPI